MRKIFKVFLILSLSVLLTACTDTQEVDFFDEAELVTLSESLVTEVVAGNVLAVYDRIEATMKKDTDLETLKNHVLLQSIDAGDFESFDETTVEQRKDPLTKQIQAGVIVRTNCENGTLLYSFIYNESIEIIGFAVNFEENK